VLAEATAMTYEYWINAKEMKYSRAGVERSVRPSVTIRRARAVMDAIGVTKVADVTKLDRVGIPNFMTVRPNDLGPGISYYNGKGSTRADAHAGALMEAVERHAGERYDGPVIAASYHNLRQDHQCVDPSEIHVPTLRAYNENTRLEWVAGFDLLNRRRTFVPLNCVLAPYNPYPYPPVFYSSTNGLASGNTRLEALCHALCEVIERDALALAMARVHVVPAIADALADIGFDRGSLPERGRQPVISLQSLPNRATLLSRKLQRAGLRVCLEDLTSQTGVATIGCTITEPGTSNAHSGCGTHPDARIALIRALTEAAQTRVTSIQGGREDLPECTPANEFAASDACNGTEDTIDFDDIASYQHPSVNEDVELLIDGMRQSGFTQIVAVELTRPEVGIPVVRVVVPRAEAWPLYCLHTGRGVFGNRMLQQIRIGLGDGDPEERCPAI